jgi:hypothetical protein
VSEGNESPHREHLEQSVTRISLSFYLLSLSLLSLLSLVSLLSLFIVFPSAGLRLSPWRRPFPQKLRQFGLATNQIGE